MAFKTLFTAMTSFEPDAPALTHAAALAKDLDAHLDVMCLGLDRSRSNYYEVGANAFLVQSALKEAHEKAETVRHDVDARLAQAAVRWSSVSVVAGPADATRPMAQAARFADLCVSSTPYRADSTPDDVLLLETMLFDA
ncbi:MAG: universal stress protein, partial [Paracoccaceae bacterium]